MTKILTILTHLVVGSLLMIMKGTGISAFSTPSSFCSTKIGVPLSAKPIALQRTLSPRRYRDVDDTHDLVTQSVKKKSTTARSLASQEKKAPPAAISIKSLAQSQALVLVATMLATAVNLAMTGHGFNINSVHWTSSTEFYSLWDFAVTPLRLLEGILAAIPMIYLGNLLEKSDQRDFSHVNFSTQNMVMILFGRRKDDAHPFQQSNADLTEEQHMLPHESSTMQTMLLTLGLALLTGMTEEILFRGVIPSAIQFQTQSVLMALFGQGLLFGVGHISPQTGVGENKIVSSFQALNGLWHGLVYLLAGGDILPCIIAHALYDSHVFMETWKVTNDQIDYTETAVRQKLTPEEQAEIRKIKQEAGPTLSAETLAYARRFFYAFDVEHCGSLTQSDVQKAISYAFWHDKVQPTAAHVQEMFERLLKHREDTGMQVTEDLKDRVNLHEFLRILFLLKANPQAAR